MKSVMILFIFVSLSHADRVVSRFEGNGYAREAVVMDEGRFKMPLIREKADDFLQRHATVPFARLEMSTEVSTHWYSGKGTTHVSVENYFHRLRIVEDAAWRRPNVASLIKIGGAALLRVRRNEQLTALYLLSGKQLPGAVDGLDVLFIAPLFDGDAVTGIQVFARSKGDVSEQKALKLAESLAKLRSDFSVWVALRADPWFITAPEFPFVYPFDAVIRHPTPEGFRAGKQEIVSVRCCASKGR